MSTRSVSPGKLIAGSILGLALLAACSGGASPGDDTATPVPPAVTTTASTAPVTPTTPIGTPTSTTAPPADASPLTLTISDTDLGPILVDGAGMTLYVFTNDSPNMSACEGQCLVNWPPLLGEPVAGVGVDESLLGSFERGDGEVQASYNEWPLYYWAADNAPGDITGQGVGGVWFVLDADGNPVEG